MYTLLLTLSLLHPLAICDEAKEEVPDTIYLPYSETEDVDFTISRPSKIGCYQWYVNRQIDTLTLSGAKHLKQNMARVSCCSRCPFLEDNLAKY